MSKAQAEQPLPQSIVLGLNAWNCKSKISNANWDTNLNEQVTVNNGDSITVSASYLDTRGSASGNIEVAVDTVISLEYYFYWMHTFNACNGKELYNEPPTVDLVTNLTQQVLVARNIGNLYLQNAALFNNPTNPVPAYPTVPNPAQGWNSTSFNDADGLPYLVYQSTPNYPVPATYGPVTPASQIVVDVSYVVHTQGLTTNWEYAGVPSASRNKLPFGWNLDTSVFVSAQNPNTPALPLSAMLLPADVNPTLPYVQYEIATLGDTAWTLIDPTRWKVTTTDSSKMRNNVVYQIDELGSTDWNLYGVTGTPTVGQVFTANTSVHPAPIGQRIVLTNDFFHNNYDYMNSPGPYFGQSPNDFFTCVVETDPGTMQWIITSFRGSCSTGGWLFNFNEFSPSLPGNWTIPPSALNAVNGIIGAAPLVITLTINTAQTEVTACAATGQGFLDGLIIAGQPQVGDLFYAKNAPNGNGTITLPPTDNDGTVKTYIAPTTKTDIRPVKKKWEMTLKAGSYDPNYLAQLISRNMSRQKLKRVNNVTGGPFSEFTTQSTLSVPTDSIWNTTAETGSTVWANPAGLGANTFYDAKNPMVYDAPPDTNYNLPPDNEDDMPFLFVPAMNGTTLHNDITDATLKDYIYAEMPHPNANGLNNLPNPKYYVNLVPLLSDVRSISATLPIPFLQAIPGDPYYSILPFYSQNNITNGSTQTGFSGIFSPVYGATQTSLLYNNENNNLFSFNYLHSPIYAYLTTGQSTLTEVTAHMISNAGSTTNMSNTGYTTTLIDKKSGILLNKMEPASFWTQLGFDIPAMTVDLDNQTAFQMTLNEFQARTTGGFCGASNIFNQNIHTTNSPDQPSVADTDLVYITSTTPGNSNQNIVAFTPNLTQGVEYTIINTGYAINTGPGGGLAEAWYDWSQVGGTTDERNGQTFICNSSLGFPTVGPAPNFIWDAYEAPRNYPTVIATKAITNPIPCNYFEVTNTNPINAVSIPTQGDNAGHYLIEITGYNSIYLDDFNKREIKSIVSSYYVSANSFVSQPFPSGYNYFHYGSPLNLSNIKIRILNPYTMQEVVGLGPNSSVYLQVNKILTAQAIAQVPN